MQNITLPDGGVVTVISFLLTSVGLSSSFCSLQDMAL